MSKINFDSPKGDGFFAKKGFYIALATCLVAIGAATWTAVHTFSSIDRDLTLDIPSAVLSSESSAVSEREISGGAAGYIDIFDDASEDNIPSAEEPAGEEVSSDSAVSAEMVQATPDEKEPAAYVLPIKGAITKNFSSAELQYSSTFSDWRIHQGIDIAGEAGSDVAAIASGTVKEVYSDPLWGTTVVIEHSGGIVAYYSGLDSETSVYVGQQVGTSQKIGRLGSIPCESADGVHLHLGIKKADEWASPLEVMKIGK